MGIFVAATLFQSVASDARSKEKRRRHVRQRCTRRQRRWQRIRSNGRRGGIACLIQDARPGGRRRRDLALQRAGFVLPRSGLALGQAGQFVPPHGRMKPRRRVAPRAGRWPERRNVRAQARLGGVRLFVHSRPAAAPPAPAWLLSWPVHQLTALKHTGRGVRSRARKRHVVRFVCVAVTHPN